MKTKTTFKAKRAAGGAHLTVCPTPPPTAPALAPLASLDACLAPDEVFLHLTQWVLPHGQEEGYYDALLTGLGFKKGKGGYFGRRGPSRATAFMAHLDCACGRAAPVGHVLTEGVVATDGTTILGADDRAGVAVLLYLWARKVPGIYCLFVGEEVGCIGSKEAATAYDWSKTLRAVSFDRRGYSSIVTHQVGRRTASDAFAEALAEQLNSRGLNFSPDPTGVYTDSEVFADTVPECTNLSVGYEGAHTPKECQDLHFLVRLARVCAEVDWEGLPTDRMPGVEEEEEEDYGYGYGEENALMGGDPVEAVLTCIDYGITPADSVLEELASGEFSERVRTLRRLVRGISGY